MARTIITPANNAALSSSAVRTVLQSMLDDWALDEFTASSTGTGQTKTLTYTPSGIKIFFYNGGAYVTTDAFTVSGTTLTVLQYVTSGESFALLYQKASF